MRTKADGVVSVMLTPFTDDNRIDWDGYEKLIEWYIENGVDTLFAVCQSSEMQHLTLEERIALARRAAELSAGRVNVIASGHISDDPDEQRRELVAMSDTGIHALVLVTNHLDPHDAGTKALRSGLDAALGWIPDDLPLGLYECPAPFRRLLSDDEFKYCRDTGRFVTLKDVSCDLETVKRRVAMAKGSGFAVVNANAAIAADAVRCGSRGFAGVFTNFHPDLYAWLIRNIDRECDTRRRLEVFLALSAMAEPMGYPGLAKLFHVRQNRFKSSHSRTTDFDIAERFWGVMALLDHIETGATQFRDEIAGLPVGE